MFCAKVIVGVVTSRGLNHRIFFRKQYLAHCVRTSTGERKLKRVLLVVAILSLLLPQILSLSIPSRDECCGRQLGLDILGVASASGYVNVLVLEAKQMIESDRNMVILDVRGQSEYDSGHLQNATLIPSTELASRLYQLDKQKDILVYCASGGRSATASQLLADNGFPSVYNMLGGITSWKNAGYWIEIVHNGDLAIRATQTFTIENCTYIQSGNVYVEDNAEFLIKNSAFEILQDHVVQYSIQVTNYATLLIENSNVSAVTVGGGGGLDLRFCNNSTGMVTTSIIANIVIRCYDSAKVRITNCSLPEAGVSGHPSLLIENSTIWSFANLYFDASQPVIIDDLHPGFYGSWNLVRDGTVPNGAFNFTLIGTNIGGWSLSLDYFASAEVKNSVIERMEVLMFDGESQLEGASPRFYNDWTANNISFLNVTVTGHWAISLCGHSSTVISNCQTFVLPSSPYSNVTALNSHVSLGRLIDSSIELGFINSTFQLAPGATYLHSKIMISGGLEGVPSNVEYLWIHTNMTRSYEVGVFDKDGRPTEAQLTVYDSRHSAVWSGVTDNSGMADFELTFADENYTGSLSLETVEGNLSVTTDVALLSDTPIILILIGESTVDINNDGVVNMIDISYVARRFMCIFGDQLWDSVADIDNNGKIDMKDISSVARHFGEGI